MSYFGSIYADQELSHRAKTVYMYLKDRSNADGTCWPSVRRIAEDLMPCVLLFLCLSPVLILFQEIRDLLWYRFMRPGAISNNEVWLTQCAEEDIRGLRDIQNTQKSTAFLSIKQKNILRLAKNA